MVHLGDGGTDDLDRRRMSELSWQHPIVIEYLTAATVPVCIVKHNVGRGFCQHFGQIGLIATKSYSDSFTTKKHSLDYYHCIIWLYYCLPLLYIIAP